MVELGIIPPMKISIGSDHGGFALKEMLRSALEAKGHEVIDFGANNLESTDYPDYAAAVARSLQQGETERGVLVCTTGVGMSIAANKFTGIRAALALNPDEVTLTRRHNNSNVITFGAKYMSAEEAVPLLDIFLATEFEGGRHARRVDKITSFEQKS